MRPQRFFACMKDGRVFAIHKGHAAAREACDGRRTYKSFRTRTEAEEFSAWLEYTNARSSRIARERIAEAIARAKSLRPRHN